MNDKHNGQSKRARVEQAFGVDSYEEWIVDKYVSGMSGAEISELIRDEVGVDVTARSVQRVVAAHGKTRSVKKAFNNAIKRGRVKWAYKKGRIKRRKIDRKKRYEVLERDGFRCTLCGAGPDDEMLEVDHIVAVHKGGGDEIENLRTLCYSCNKGRYLSGRLKNPKLREPV